MDNSYPHLGAPALPFIDLPAAERIKKIREKGFAEFPRCRHVMDLMCSSADLNTNLLFWGESGAGKTTIIRRYLKEHPPRFDESSGVRETPVIAILMPPVCDPKWLYVKLLDECGAPPPLTRPHVSQLERRVVELCRTMKVRQIVIDETHDLMTGTARQQRVMLNVIRHLTNELAIPLVLFGTEAARTALMPDPQLARRFRVHKIHSWAPGEEFNDLIGSILRTFPLRRESALTKRALKGLVSFAQGNTGSVFNTLIELAVRALESSDERITAEAVMEYIEIQTTAAQ